MADVRALGALAAHRLVDRAEGRAPADDRELAALGAEFDELVGNLDAVHLGLADIGHRLMVVGRIVDVPCIDFLLDTADAVKKAGRAGLHPWSLELFVAAIGFESALGHFGQEFDRKGFIAGQVGYRPRLGRVGDIAVGQQHHRGHILHRNAARLDRAFERVAGRSRGNHRHWRVAVAAIDRLIEVRLLGFRRQAGRGSAALRIDDDERQLGHDGKAHRLALQRDARPRRTGHAERPAIARADRRTDRRDLVFGLEGRDVIFLEPRQMVQDRRCRGDRIAAEKHRQFRKLCARDETERDALGAGQRAVETGRDGRGIDVVLLERSRKLGGLAIGVAGVQRRNIGGRKVRVLRELAVEPVDQRLTVAVEHPEREPQRPHILAAQRFLVAEAEGFHGIHGELTDIQLEQLPFRKAAVVERVRVIFRLGEVAIVEFALVGDDQPARLQLRNIGLERRRVHRDEHVGRVARGLDRRRAEIDLEGRDPEQCSLRGANLGRNGGRILELADGRQQHARLLEAGDGVFINRSVDHGAFEPQTCHCASPLGEKEARL